MYKYLLGLREIFQQDFRLAKGPFTLDDNDVFFFYRHVPTVTLVTMPPISDGMLTSSKICVVVAKCEWALNPKLPPRNLRGIVFVITE